MAEPKSQRERLREQQKAAKRKRTITWITAAVVVIVGGLLLHFLPKWTADNTALPTQDGFSIGDPNAPVKVEEFSDFRCSHCRDFSDNDEEAFITKYVETGKVYMTFYNFPFLADDSYDAAEAAYCAADQNAFWQYKTLLFKYNSHSDAYIESNLVDYAKQLGLDTDSFSACLQSDQHLADIEADKEYATSLGIDSTPQFKVNDTNVFKNELDQTVEAELAK
ncbi:MAG: thioredoxin domain-containing protein [Anaerolineaceae bacterium]